MEVWINCVWQFFLSSPLWLLSSEDNLSMLYFQTSSPAGLTILSVISEHVHLQLFPWSLSWHFVQWFAQIMGRFITILIYTCQWRLIKSVGRNGSRTMLFVMKVMVWPLVINSHQREMTVILILSNYCRYFFVISYISPGKSLHELDKSHWRLVNAHL